MSAPKSMHDALDGLFDMLESTGDDEGTAKVRLVNGARFSLRLRLMPVFDAASPTVGRSPEGDTTPDPLKAPAGPQP